MTVQLGETWSERLRSLPEAGMGYQLVDVILRDGRCERGLLVFNGRELQVSDLSQPLDVSEILRIDPHRF